MPTAKEMDTHNAIDNNRLSGRDAHLVKMAPELFDLLVEVVEAYEFGGMTPDLVIRAKRALRKAMGGSV